MFTEPEVVKFTEPDDEFCYVILTTDEFIDMSIFTVSEWEKLELIAQLNRKNQSELEDLSDYSYTWFFDSTNPNYKENVRWKKSIEFMDVQMGKVFGIKFSELDPKFGTKKELKKIYESLDFLITNKTVTKDKLRKWFIDNYPVINNN